MRNEKTFLAIIPARGGSKRLPHKNILDLDGKPVIAWTIVAAKKSQYIDTIVVTSDDEKILEISTRFGAKILKRPEILSSDTATTFDALKHAIDHFPPHDYIILLQPTSPFRNAIHIDEAIELLYYKNCNTIISVTKMEHSSHWSNILPDDDNMNDFINDTIKTKRSQELESYYRLNGATYISQTTIFLNEKTFFLSNNSYAYKMNFKSSIDIDTQDDLDMASYILKYQQLRNG